MTARYAGGSAQLPSGPVSVTVTPTALLSRPVPRRIAPTSLRIGLNSLDVAGTLRPQHKAGTKAVRLEVWWSIWGQDWERLKTVTAPVRSVGGASVYSLKILADEPGRTVQDPRRPRGRGSRAHVLPVQQGRGRLLTTGEARAPTRRGARPQRRRRRP